MKNNKGFAISSVVYAMLILFLGLILLILGNLASRKAMFDKEKNEILMRFNNYGSSKKFENGEVVYFNVTSGELCSSSEYTETQSNTGVKEGCMKFYAFNDDGKNKVNLILDHNTTNVYGWSDDIANGPSRVLEILSWDTRSWKGTITPANYTIDQTGQTSNAKYTIDYSGYKARLITAQEIATITDYSGWDEKVAENSSSYYLESKTGSQSDTCKEGNTTGCSYGWLYDRTKTNCTTYGCLNNSDEFTCGYWTASSRAARSSIAWQVDYEGYVSSTGVLNPDTYGVRPVIEVLKSKLS